MRFRAFPERVGPQILLLERFDNFGTCEHCTSVVKKKEQS